MKRSKSKVGAWTYEKRNETLLFHGSHHYTYEVDLERKTVAEWRDHLSHKAWLTTQDLTDFDTIIEQVRALNAELPIFTNKPEAWFLRRMVQEEPSKPEGA